MTQFAGLVEREIPIVGRDRRAIRRGSWALLHISPMTRFAGLVERGILIVG
jgi:hypothetical protein